MKPLPAQQAMLVFREIDHFLQGERLKSKKWNAKRTAFFVHYKTSASAWTLPSKDSHCCKTAACSSLASTRACSQLASIAYTSTHVEHWHLHGGTLSAKSRACGLESDQAFRAVSTRPHKTTPRVRQSKSASPSDTVSVACAGFRRPFAPEKCSKSLLTIHSSTIGASGNFLCAKTYSKSGCKVCRTPLRQQISRRKAATMQRGVGLPADCVACRCAATVSAVLYAVRHNSA